MSLEKGVTSSHYDGQKGLEYFEWQNQFGARSGQIESRKFARFIKPNYSILDFGCGSGHLLNSLHAKTKYGVEVNPYAVQHAKNFGIKIVASASEIESNSIDCVISNHALEHVPFPLDSLRELRRLIVPGGKMILCIPIDDWRKSKKFRTVDINNHLHTWTPQLIGNLLIEAGFEPALLKISILRSSWFPGTKYLWKHERLFDFGCKVFCILSRNGYQIMVEATK